MGVFVAQAASTKKIQTQREPAPMAAEKGQAAYSAK